MKRISPVYFLLLPLLLFGLAIVPEPAVLKHEEALENATTFIQTQHNQTLQLCAEAPNVAPDVYWLWNDNFLAYYALKDYNETMANEIFGKLEEFGYMKNHAYEALFNQTIELPFRAATDYIVEEGAGYIIKLDMYNGSIMNDWQDYANLLCLAALSEYWRCGYDNTALLYFNMAVDLWDGKGIADASFQGRYHTYKLALLLYTERILGQTLEFHDTIETTMWHMQNRTTYGIHTDYDPNLDPSGSDVNVETTALVIGAYKYSFQRACPSDSPSPTRTTTNEFEVALVVSVIAIYIGMWMLKNRRKR